ncbi:uncharacterized protein LOC134680683 [Mytilus trossulus]|uniref:uncharacterized protein LOC134680683 n=1 Tax=Mytilus trossulus TaxID=6551 RepID=UPI0030070269
MASPDVKPDTSNISTVHAQPEINNILKGNDDVRQHESIEFSGFAVQTEGYEDVVPNSHTFTEKQSLSSATIGLSQHGLPFHLVELAHKTVLDKQVLDNLISKCIIAIEDREEIIKPTTQFERNKVLLEILIERPYNCLEIFKNVLKQFDPCASDPDVLELLKRIEISVESEPPSNISQAETMVNTNTIKLHKNYHVLLHNMDCTTDVVDHLLQSEVLEPEDREEICSINLTKHESNRRLLATLMHKDKNAYNMFLDALRHASHEHVVDDLENTEVTTHDNELCHIGMIQLRERHRKKAQGLDMISKVEKNLTKIQRELQNVIPANIREIMRLQIEEWILKDRSFISTRGSEHVRNCAQDNNCVTITGSAGVGKSFISRHVALNLQENGYIIIPVMEPTQIINYYQPGRNTVFVVDDICGKFTASQQQIEKWQQLLPVIKTILEDKCCKIIVTCRLQVFKDRQFGVLSRLFKSCVCNLISDELRLTRSEKTKMAESYFGKHMNELDLTEVSEQSFPLLCSLCHMKPKMDVYKFFKSPFEVYKDELDILYCSGLMKICSLVMIVLYNNKLDGELFSGDITDEQRNLLDDTFEACLLERGTSKMKLKSAIDTLVGSYISEENNVYRSLHDRLFDFFAHYFGHKMIHLIIKHGDSGFLSERVVWKPTIEDHKNDVEFTITLPDQKLPFYLKRLISDWSNGKVTNVFYNDSMKIPAFRQQLLLHLNQLDQTQRCDLTNKRDNEREDFAAGNTPLIKSCRGGYSDIVEWLLDNNGNVNVSRANGVTPLFMAAQDGHTNIVRMLLNKKADVNLSKNAGGTPLRMAAQQNHSDVVRLLIEHNADVDAQMYDGDNPLLTVTRNGFSDIVQVLLAKKADCNKSLQSKQIIADFVAKHPPKTIKSVQQSWLKVANKYGS